ncbi:hypothetical protein [Streptomyces sp. NPDC006384]
MTPDTPLTAPRAISAVLFHATAAPEYGLRTPGSAAPATAAGR